MKITRSQVSSDTRSKHWFTIAAAIVFIAGTVVPSFAQPPPLTPTTKVMVGLTIKPGVSREEVMKEMPGEIRETVKLYLDGKIDQWFSRSDGQGVVFIVNGKDTDEAKKLMDELPLAKSGLVDFTYTSLSPLMPLKTLLQSSSAGPKNTP